MRGVGNGWQRVRLGDVVVAKYGKALPQAKRRGGDVPVFGSNGIVGSHDEPLTCGPSIVVGRKGSSGAVNFSPVACWPIDTTYYIDDPGPYSIRFLDCLLRTLGLTELDRSTAIPGLNREQLYDIELPLPGIDEQDAIVDAIDSIEDKRVRATGHLDSARRAAGRLRYAVLAAACSGRLTADWREDHAAALERPTTATQVQPLVETPDSWAWTALGQIADIRGGIQVGAKRKPGETLREVPYLRVANVQQGWLDLSEMKTIAAPESKIAALRLEPGDVFFNEGGDRDKLGRGWVWEGQIPECIHQNHVFRARLRDHSMQPRFYSWFGNTFGMLYFFDEGKQTVNLASLSKAKLSELPVPVPSPQEQAEIVRRVSDLILKADQVVEHARTAAESVDRSSLAVLAKAFRGGL